MYRRPPYAQTSHSPSFSGSICYLNRKNNRQDQRDHHDSHPVSVTSHVKVRPLTCDDAAAYTLKRNLSPMVEVRWQLRACGL